MPEEVSVWDGVVGVLKFVVMMGVLKVLVGVRVVWVGGTWIVYLVRVGTSTGWFCTIGVLTRLGEDSVVVVWVFWITFCPLFWVGGLGGGGGGGGGPCLPFCPCWPWGGPGLPSLFLGPCIWL